MSTDPLAEDVEALSRSDKEALQAWFHAHSGGYGNGLEGLWRTVERILAAHDAQVRDDERQKVAARLADEGTVEKVAAALTPGGVVVDTDLARAVLDVLAGLIGGEGE